ncbi:MAG: hypothetical protein WA672_01635 [Candidatus Angelobacter sp.]
MLIKNGAIAGAAVGSGIAAVMILLDQWMPFSVPISSFIDRAIFRVCPFYILGFSKYVTNKPTWFLVTILGNALLYGFLGVLIAAGVVLFRRVAHNTVS